MKKIEKKRKKKPAAAFMYAYYIRVGGDLNTGEPRHADVVKSCIKPRAVPPVPS